MRQIKNTRHFVKRLEKNGYRYDRSNGSHRIYVNANGEIISVPRSGNKMVLKREAKKHCLR